MLFPKRFTHCLLSLALANSALVVVQADGHDNTNEAKVISVGNIRPEGIHALSPEEASQVVGMETEDDYVLVGGLLSGRVNAFNLASGEETPLAESQALGTRAAVGLWYDSGAIFACGGGRVFGFNETFDPVVYVYNASTGEEIAQCGAEVAGFCNDVTVVNDKAYATDSIFNTILELDVAAALEGTCVTRAIATPPAFFLEPEGFKANGIVGYADGLLIVTGGPGGLYYLDLTTGETTEVLAVGSVVCGDGLAIGPTEDGLGDILYVSENCFNRHSAWLLQSSPGTVSAEPLGYLLSDSYDSPTTCAVVGDMLWSVNARFDSVPFSPPELDTDTFLETFDLVGVNRFEFQSAAEEVPVDADDVEASGDMGADMEEGSGDSPSESSGDSA